MEEAIFCVHDVRPPHYLPVHVDFDIDCTDKKGASRNIICIIDHSGTLMTTKMAPNFVHIMLAARQEARRLNGSSVGIGHVFMALCHLGGLTEELLRSKGVDPRTVRLAIARSLDRSNASTSHIAIHYTQELHTLLGSFSADAANEMTAEISEVELLAAIAREEHSLPAKVLREFHLDLNELLQNQPQHPQAKVLTDNRASSATTSKAYKQLVSFGRDLTQLAQDNKIWPAVGRDDEIRHVEQTLVRATKRNPVLLGEAGVGKTAIVEGLAYRIVHGDVIPALRSKRIVEINLAQVTAGTSYRGGFEENLLKIINAARETPDIILAIDELHTLVGTGGPVGGLDASNIMKPVLGRGEIQLIGATTRDEYRKYIEPDAALERRFQTIIVDEPTPQDTVQILTGIQEHFEKHHKVCIDRSALQAAAQLSARFLPTRRLPDKAIDLLDEACAYTRLHAPPAGVQTPAPPARVSAPQIAIVLSEWTGLPITELSRKQRRRLLEMPSMLTRRVLGQDEAVRVVTRALETALTGLRSGNRPIAVLLFVGPTGVGKTELAKALAQFMFGSDTQMIRLDMSEYQERHQVAKLIGAPPGYIGHDEAGLLTEGLRNKPYSIVLLDEVEKAHPDVFDIFLQLFDDGRLTDSHGKTADGTNAIFIMTSNIGTGLYDTGGEIGKTPDELADVRREEILRECKRFFRPEFINRIDEIVVFRLLTQANLELIVERFFAELRTELSRQGLDIQVEAGVVAHIVQRGYEPMYGARPLRRAFEQLVVQPIAHRLVTDDPLAQSQITVSLRDNGLVISYQQNGR